MSAADRIAEIRARVDRLEMWDLDDAEALLVAVEAVRLGHSPREEAVLSDPTCINEECDHEAECPPTGSVTVCHACWCVAEGVDLYFAERGIPDEVLYPCATLAAIDGALA